MKRKRPISSASKGSPSASEPVHSERSSFTSHKVLITAVVLGLVTLLLYMPTAWHSFIAYDDDTYILDNPHVLSGIGLTNLRWAFQSSYAGNWHPITWISHMFDCQLFGSDPGPPHFINSLIHSANAVLLFLVLLQLTGFLWRSGFVAALFAFHPLHVESVAWLAERKDLLSTFFSFLVLLMYAFYAKTTESAPVPSPKNRRNYYVLALFFYGLGLMCKPMLVTLPFVLLILDYWPLNRIEDFASVRRLCLEKLPFFVLGVLSSVVTFIIQRKAGAVASLENLPILSRITNAALSYSLYLGKMFWPQNLMIPYVPELHQSSSGGMLAIGLLSAMTTAAVVLRSRCGYPLAGWLWYLGTLVPVIGIVQVGIQSMADRYTYVPSIGIFILVTWSAAELIRVWRVPTMVNSIVSMMILGGLWLGASRQLAFWKNSETLFLHSASIDPMNLPVTALLAWSYASDPDPKLRDGQKAIQLAQFCVDQTGRREPWYLDILAAAHAEAGNFPVALKTANEALILVGKNNNSEFVSDLKSRIELYKAGRAVHRP